MEIIPNVGIGKVRLGMSAEEADWLRQPGMQLDSAGNPPVVTFIQVDDASGAEYRGVDLFFDSADEVVEAIVRLEGLDPADYPPGKHEYLFPTLNMILWRGEVSDEPGGQGYTFQAASIHVPDYYQRATPKQAPREPPRIDPAPIIAQLRQKGWTIEVRPGDGILLPPAVAARYPRLPAPLLAFLSRMSSSVDKSETSWFLCAPDYHGTSGSAFRWDEWERMSIEAADGHPRLLAEVRAFWDVHFPLMMSVHSGYSYYAVRTAADGFGRIVKGHEPEFEEATTVAESFEQFLSTVMGLPKNKGKEPR